MTNKTMLLNNGIWMPAMGFGVYQVPNDETIVAVTDALKSGYRLIDTAAAYGNELGVGEAIRRSDVPRDELFVETKIWISDYGYDKALHGYEKSAAKLGVGTIDLLLLHQPLTTSFDLTVGAYRALEKLLADGLVNAIGVSNFMPAALDKLLGETDVVPAVNQIEVHPFFQQRGLEAMNTELGIITQAWSPIGGVTIHRGGNRRTLDDPVIRGIADEHHKTPAQVMLKWHIQQGRAVIPKSVRRKKIDENFRVWSFELTDEELAAIDALDTNVRVGPEPDTITLEEYGIEIPEA